MATISSGTLPFLPIVQRSPSMRELFLLLGEVTLVADLGLWQRTENFSSRKRVWGVFEPSVGLVASEPPPDLPDLLGVLC